MIPLVALIPLSTSDSPKLTVGSLAPPLKGARYARGKAIDLKRGIHVVEFWATWCGPCRESIPHLAEMARKYKGKADVTGISVWENGPDPSGQVSRFVDKMGPRMAYNVAWEGSAKFASSAWLAAADIDGIPSAFLVRDGRILWIGSPFDGLDHVLAQTVAGTFDLAEAKRQAKKKAEEKRRTVEERETYRQFVAPIEALRSAKDYVGALRALDDLAVRRPELQHRLQPMRFELLVKSGSPEQLAFARRLANEDYKDRGGILAALAWTVVAPDSGLVKPDYEAARVLSQRAIELRPEDCMILATHARVLFLLGDRAKAVEFQTKALERAKLDPRVDEDGLASYRQQLEEYRRS